MRLRTVSERTQCPLVSEEPPEAQRPDSKSGTAWRARITSHLPTPTPDRRRQLASRANGLARTYTEALVIKSANGVAMALPDE